MTARAGFPAEIETAGNGDDAGKTGNTFEKGPEHRPGRKRLDGEAVCLTRLHRMPITLAVWWPSGLHWILLVEGAKRVDRVEDEPLLLCCPDFADVFAGSETIQRLEPSREVAGCQEVGEVDAQLGMVVVMVSLDGGVLDPRIKSEDAVHPLDLAIGPWVVGLGQLVLDAVGLTDHVEAHRPGVDRVAVPGLFGELHAVVSQNGMDLTGYGFEHVLQKLCGGASGSRFNELSNNEPGGPVDADEAVWLSFTGLNLGDVDVEESDRAALELALELLALRPVPLDIRQARDAMLPHTPVQRRAGQMWNRWLQGIKAVIQRQKRVAKECHDHCLLCFRQHSGARFGRPGLAIFDRRTLAPLRHRPGVDPDSVSAARAKLAIAVLLL